MKICWDNIEELEFTKRGNFKYRGHIVYAKTCLSCSKEYIGRKESSYCDNECACKSEEYRNNISKSNKKENHWNWKGGVSKKNIPLYDTHYLQLNYAEECRRTEKGYLEVKCAYCGKWFVPKYTDVMNRRNSLEGNYPGEQRFYCSYGCKRACPIWNQKLYPKDFKINTSREVQPQLRQMVFERDNWICIKCGNIDNLHCHHIEGIRYDPIESTDIDKCITVCKQCHKVIHQKDGCGYHDLRCINETMLG